MFENLRQEIREIDSVIDSAIVFISDLSDKLAAALNGADSEADIQKIIDDLDEHKAKLATAIAANTQAENDSDQVDNGPTDGSAVEPDDGSPVTDETQQPEGGEPEESNDSGIADDGTLTVPVDETNLGDDAGVAAGAEEAAEESSSGTTDDSATANEAQDEGDSA